MRIICRTCRSTARRGSGRDWPVPDPVTDAGDPQQWNAYAYANNSPVNKSDANGLKVGCDFAAECSNNHDYVRSNGQAVDAVFIYSPPASTAPTPPPTADQQKAQEQKAGAEKVRNEGKRKRDEIVHQVVDLIGDLIGFNDARDCFTKGDVMACVNTALNAVPWGKLFKAVKVGIKAFKIYKEIDKAYDMIRSGERAMADAEKAIVRANTAAAEARAAERAAAKAAEEKAAKETATDAAGTEGKAVAAEADEAAGTSCPLRRNSFPTGTQVLMGDGTLKPIEEIHDGDVVMATDPQTGETRPETVTATITTPDDKDFTDLTLTDEASPRGPPADNPAKITSTYHHPYWSETRQQWVDAGELTPGEHLRRPDGTTLTIQSVRNYPYAVTTHNLTVSLLHTYYVLVGSTSVLVHNCAAPTIRISPAASDWATKGAHMHVGSSEVRIFPTGDGGVGFEGLRMSNGMASARDVAAARNAIMSNPEMRADLIDKARSAMADMNDHNWGNSVNRAPEMNFLIKALEKIE
ncbi:MULTISPECIES: polymorphic toxin-type HINT domain-containing protein [unclassified Kitasatospora]|uniref:polymorphic toxin-type HINT domain-containing protein n=1 Tax=unclassified Kitasatospora TaxID=2633591 RepID=UPI00381CD10E